MATKKKTTALSWIIDEAKSLKKNYPKRFSTWKEYVAQASAIYASKHKGKSPVGKKKIAAPAKVKTAPARSTHKDTKSHNVNIRVMSGMKKNKKIGAMYENKVPAGKKMYARIDDLAYIYVGNIGGGQLREYLKSNANKWVEIDTKFLFSDQYNTIDGYRIYDTMINAIKNDAREGIKEFENDDSCCFLIWKGIKPEPLPLPDSIDKIAKREPMWKNPTYKIGSYEFESMFLKHYKLQNSRQRIKFLYWNKTYFITSGIGYKAKKSLSLGYPVSYAIPDNVKKKVDQILNSL